MDASTFNAGVAHAPSTLPVGEQPLQATDKQIERVTKKAPVNRIIGKVTVTPYQSDLFKVSLAAYGKVLTASDSMSATMRKAIYAQYGDTMPTFKQFQADRSALKVLATEKGLKDDQWVRKPYNLAIHALYGALPEAQTEAAILKREQRAAAAAAKLANGDQPKAKTGPAKDDTSKRNPGAQESIEQFVTRVGVFAALKAITAILKTQKDSQTDATAIEAIAKHYKK